MKLCALRTVLVDGFGRVGIYIIKTRYLGRFKLLILVLIIFFGKRTNQVLFVLHLDYINLYLDFTARENL